MFSSAFVLGLQGMGPGGVKCWDLGFGETWVSWFRVLFFRVLGFKVWGFGL